MTKKNQSRAAKMVLASLLAVSLSVPTFSGVTLANTNEAAIVVSAKEAKTVAIQTFKSGTKELEPAISNHLAPEGKIVEKDGKFEAIITVVAKSAPMIAGFQTKSGAEFIDATEVKNEDGTITYKFPVVAGEALESKIHVLVPTHNMDKWYDFDLVAAEVEVEEAPAPAKTFAVTVYKDGTNAESTMKDYVEPNVKVAKSSTGHSVTMTIKKNQEQYIHDFKVAGEQATKGTKDGQTTYTFEVANTTGKVNAELHVVVDAYGVKYDENHKVQFGFTDNPFSDIEKDGNKEAILSLFDKEIVKGNAKFNPMNNISRSQFALMVYRALDMDKGQYTGFTDITNLNDAERVNAINALADAGIVQKNANFNPNGTLTRQQGALMLYRAVNYVAGQEMNYGDTSLPFYVDGKTVTDPEAQKAFALLHTGQIMTGSPTANGGKEIKAASSLTRSQMAKILHGSLKFMDQK